MSEQHTSCTEYFLFVYLDILRYFQLKKYLFLYLIPSKDRTNAKVLLSTESSTYS